MDILNTIDLSKSYNNKFVVDKVNMHIEKGDIYGFVGENGAGKTTVIRMICGLAKPTNGEFKLFDVSSNNIKIGKAREKMSGIVESVSVIRNMTALNNLIFQAKIVNSKKTKEELIQLLKDVGLNYEEIKNKKAGDFSLGMRQRLGIAITMISDPEFVILDEPMNGLDPQGFVEMRNTILNLNKKGVTFLISSHILSELEKVCNKIGFISHGKILEETTIDELHAKARNRIVVESDNNELLLELLKNKLELKDIVEEKNQIIIYDSIDINLILKLVYDNKITLIHFSEIEGTIEDYYLDLVMGGMDNA